MMQMSGSLLSGIKTWLDAQLSDIELDQLEIQTSKQIVSNDPDDPHWIAFTSAEAQWIYFTVDPKMGAVFAERERILADQDDKQCIC